MSENIRVGDRFPLDEIDFGDCSGIHVSANKFAVLCALDEGHGGPHVATDGETVVEVWGND